MASFLHELPFLRFCRRFLKKNEYVLTSNFKLLKTFIICIIVMIFCIIQKQNTLFLGYIFESVVSNFYKIDQRFREFIKQFFRFILTRSALSDSADYWWQSIDRFSKFRVKTRLLFIILNILEKLRFNNQSFNEI